MSPSTMSSNPGVRNQPMVQNNRPQDVFSSKDIEKAMYIRDAPSHRNDVNANEVIEVARKQIYSPVPQRFKPKPRIPITELEYLAKTSSENSFSSGNGSTTLAFVAVDPSHVHVHHRSASSFTDTHPHQGHHSGEPYEPGEFEHSGEHHLCNPYYHGRPTSGENQSLTTPNCVNEYCFGIHFSTGVYPPCQDSYANYIEIYMKPFSQINRGFEEPNIIPVENRSSIHPLLIDLLSQYDAPFTLGGSVAEHMDLAPEIATQADHHNAANASYNTTNGSQPFHPTATAHAPHHVEPQTVDATSDNPMWSLQAIANDWHFYNYPPLSFPSH